MRTIHFRQHPINGDSTLKAPNKYKFSRMHHRHLIHILKIITDSGAFSEDVRGFYTNSIRTWVGGYLAYDGEKLIGCVLLTMQNGFPTIKYLYVAPSYRRKRVGWFLANMCMLRAKANTYDEIHAYVDKDNISGAGIFRRLGFEEIE